MMDRIAMRRLAVRASLFLSLAGCAGGAPPPTASGPTWAGQARITITRSDDALFLGAPAAITVNGESVGSLWRGDKLATVTMPGRVTVTAGTWSYPGRSTLSFAAEAGREYDLAIYPRGSAFFGSMFLPLMLVDAVSDDGGAFAIRPAAQ